MVGEGARGTVTFRTAVWGTVCPAVGTKGWSLAPPCFYTKDFLRVHSQD